MFECMRCGYLSKRKYNLITHLKRKKQCEATLLDVERCYLLEELEVDRRRKPENIVIQHKKQQNLIHTVSGEYPVSIRKVSKNLSNTHFACSYCNKTFKHKNNMYRHEKHRCKLNPVKTQEQLIELKNIILKQQEEINLLKQQTPQSTNTNHSYNTSHSHNKKHNTNSFNTVNVNLNTIGNENIEYLKTFLMKNIKDIVQCKSDFIIEYVKQKHFHPDHIENHNVVAFNQRSNSLYAYMKQDTHLEHRLKNSISLVLYKNIIDDFSVFIDTQLQREKIKQKRMKRLTRAAKTIVSREDAVSDYERKDVQDEYDETEKKTNIKLVDTHLKEIENTIYNESKSTYGDISSYYGTHNESEMQLKRN